MSAGYRKISLAGADRQREYQPKVAAALLFGIASTGLYLAGIALSDPLLTVRSLPEPADIIVVLGGDGPTRADRAAALYKAGLASRLLVTGDGDCTDIATQMVRSGVRPQAITLECASRTTEENATLSAPLLRVASVRKAILVTSWFHSRRAIETFETEMPAIAWLSVPTEPSGSPIALAMTHEGLQIAKEYPKTIVYRWRRLFREQRALTAQPTSDIGPRTSTGVDR